MKRLAGLLTLLALALPGLARADIVVGQTAGLTGAAASNVKAMTFGAELIINAANANGGINGERIRLVSLDDGLDVAKTVANAKKLLDEEKAIALFLTRGTPNTLELLPLLKARGVPLVGPSTGAMALHEPPIREVFNVRPTYVHEAEAAVKQLGAMHVGSRIGVIYSGDAFGKDAMVGVKKGFEAIGAKPLFEFAYDRKTEDVTKAIEMATTAKDGQYPSLLIIGTNRVTTNVIEKARAAGNRSGFIATLSTNASDGFIDGLGDNSSYIIVAQAFPSASALSEPLVAKVSRLLKQTGSTQRMSPAMFEGAMAAEVLLEGLRRCASPCSSAKLITALESGRPINVGLSKQSITYTKDKRSGIRYADMSIIRDGKFVH